MKPKILFATILFFSLAIYGFSYQIAGIVFEDKNANSVRDVDEVGIPNVGVSDGLEIAITDATGRYNLNIDTAAPLVFVTVPSGYSYQSSFYYLLEEQSSRNKFNFGLQKVLGKPSDYFVQVTDIHIDTTLSTAADFKSAINELNRLNPPPAFIIATGDLVSRGSYTTQFDLYIDGVKQSKWKWYHAFGNHDANEGDDRAMNYHYYIGPDYYSFDYLEYHFIVLNSVLTSARQQQWLDNDIKILAKNKPLIVFQHYPPQPGLRHDPIVSLPKSTVLITGHWHADKIWEENGQYYISTPPLRFGGIDASPAGYRLVYLKFQVSSTKYQNKKSLMKQSVTTEYRPLGKRVQIVPPVLIEDISANSQPTTDWNSFKKDRIRNAVSENAINLPLGLAWLKKIDSAQVMLSSPLVNNNIIYLAVQNKNELGGRIVAVNAISGKLIRSAKTRLAIKHTPVIDNEMLYAVDIGGRIYAFSIPSFQLKWSYDLDDGISHWIYSAPVVATGNLYAGNAGRFVCLDSKTGNQIWEKKYGSDWVSSWASPSIANDTLYFGAIWNEKNCYAVDVKTGEIIWSYKCSGLHTSPVPEHNKVYIADIDGKLAALDINSGQEAWVFQMDKSWSLTTPTIAKGLVLAASGKGTIYAVDAETGELHWQFRASESLLKMSPYQPNYATIFSSPVVTGKTVYICGSDGLLYALDLSTGNLNWKQDFNIPLLSTPAISGNMLYVVTLDGTIYAFCSRQ